jgi:hypothetical protein
LLQMTKLGSIWTLINKTSTSEKKNGWIIGNNNWHRDGSDSKISSWNKIYLFVNTNIYIETEVKVICNKE